MVINKQDAADVLKCQHWDDGSDKRWYNLSPLRLEDNKYYKIDLKADDSLIFNLCEQFKP